MGAKPTLTPGTIFRMLQAEFERERPPACVTCKIPLPCAAARVDATSANWRLEAPRECPHNCAAVITELARDLASRYDMSDYVPYAPQLTT